MWVEGFAPSYVWGSFAITTDNHIDRKPRMSYAVALMNVWKEKNRAPEEGVFFLENKGVKRLSVFLTPYHNSLSASHSRQIFHATISLMRYVVRRVIVVRGVTFCNTRRLMNKT